MAYSDSSSSGADGGAPPSIWPSSLDDPASEKLHRYALLVPLGCRLAKSWRVEKDGYAMLGPAAMVEELRTHRGGRYNIYGRHIFWDGKSFNDVINQHRRASAAAGNLVNPGGSQRRPRSRALTPSPCQWPRLWPRRRLTSRRSRSSPAAAAALPENTQSVVEDDDDDIDSDNLGNSSNDNDGVDGDGAVEGPDVVYLDMFD
ncbi:hypothetical protein D1007_02662 [Hordeum vulgare]|nr:hypothetical protein D1007_02662 [Hordeum vulgare]